MKIIFPEQNNSIAKMAIASFPDIEFLPAENLGAAVNILKERTADSMISGLDHSSRDVLLTYKNNLKLKSNFFSSCFICEKDNKHFALADGGVNKQPTKEQLLTIVEDTARTFETYYEETPKIAMLSYSTNGSGGKNPDIEKIFYVIENIRKNHPDWIIDGEMQLDVAINQPIAEKKNPSSAIKGDANILITPDLNSGNILYKALERFGGFVCAGPIIQGFEIPLADLSRGSTVEDVKLTIKVIKTLLSTDHTKPLGNNSLQSKTNTNDMVKVSFGTDGIRTKADAITPELLAKIVRGLADYAGTNKTVLIGGDTRESTERILSDLSTALSYYKIKHASVGVLPTPAINYCFYEMGYDFAIDITASHNPYQDNGIKIFERSKSYGIKLSEFGKKKIEASLNSPIDYSPSSSNPPEDLHDEALNYYKEHLKFYLGETSFKNLSIALDCANGAMSVVGESVFKELGAAVSIINAESTFNQKINDNCGSTHLDELKSLVADNHLNLGIAFDGDGDRVLMVDEDGTEVDGDQIIAILADYFKLSSVAITVMSNQGLLNYATKKRIHTEITDVGDSNVAEAMRQRGIKLGGEQSGHIILPNEPTGDGMLTALVVLKAIIKTEKSLKELSSVFEKLPQIIVNLKANPDQKEKLKTSDKVKEILEYYNNEVESIEGRLLVRPSGTENLIRITVWGNDEAKIESLAEELKTKLGDAL